MRTFCLTCKLPPPVCAARLFIAEEFRPGDASFTATTRTETLLNGKSAASDRSSFCKYDTSFPFSVWFSAVAHAPPLSIKSPEKSDF